MKRSSWLLGAAVLLVVRLGAQDQAPEPRGLHALDFWVGTWKVVLADGQKAGDNRIEKLLGGFALQENWSEPDHHEGKSWFYFHRLENRWKQVWVTDGGFVKEKAQEEGAPPGSVRFQGVVIGKGGVRILDRTTLTPMPEGRVRQVIETSRDEGATWQTGFDAIYIPVRS
ncbi:MAG TPA: hypothetical protein VHD61_07895 [Lacunisphaera sp.]|nr:hypothetical protein [Lacunisphaera sp.]